MARKNLLGDTDYTKGKDTRFGQSVVIGRVSKIEVDEKHANVRVLMSDKKDHKGTPLISKPIPVLQVASTAKRSFMIPRLGTPVALIKLPNGTADYMVVGSFYTERDPPPVDDPMLDYVIYDDGSVMQFDASNGQLDWSIKGDYNYLGEKKYHVEVHKDVTVKSTEGKVTVEAQSDVLVKSNAGKVTVQGATEVAILGGPKVTITGTTIYLNGNIIHTGNMNTTGVHQDSLGFHTGAAGAGTESWNWTTGLERVAPTGQVGINATTWEAATRLRISKVAANNRDMAAVLAATFVPGNEVYLQLKTDSTRFGRYTLVDDGTDLGDAREYAVVFKEGGGALPSNNATTTVTIIDKTSPYGMRLAAMEQRIQQLEAQLR